MVRISTTLISWRCASIRFAPPLGHPFDVFCLLEEQILRRQLGVERDQVGGLAPLPQHFLDDALEVLVGQVVGEVEIRLGFADAVQPFFPDLVGLLVEGVVQPLPPLAPDRLLAHVRFEGFRASRCRARRAPCACAPGCGCAGSGTGAG